MVVTVVSMLVRDEKHLELVTDSRHQNFGGTVEASVDSPQVTVLHRPGRQWLISHLLTMLECTLLDVSLSMHWLMFKLVSVPLPPDRAPPTMLNSSFPIPQHSLPH